MQEANDSIKKVKKVLDQVPLESIPVFFQKLSFKPNTRPKGIRPIFYIEVSEYQSSKHLMSYAYKNISKSVNLK